MKNNKNHYSEILSIIKEEGLFKKERTISTPQCVEITTEQGKKVLNFCANNYLGLANHPDLIKSAKNAMDIYGFGMASVRFICGTQDIHKALEEKISDFFGTDDTILYTSCFDANGGLFETILGEEDAVISDSLNHASIIDGIRLCKAKRLRYQNNDMLIFGLWLQHLDFLIKIHMLQVKLHHHFLIENLYTLMKPLHIHHLVHILNIH